MIQYYCVLLLLSSSFGHWMYFQLVPVSLWHILTNNFFFFFLFWVFCTFWHYKNLQAHFVSSAYPVLESVIFPRSHGSFYWRIELEIWVLGVFIVANALLILTYVCHTHYTYIYTLTLAYIHTHIYILLHVYTHYL